MEATTMDRKIKKSKWTKNKITLYVVGACIGLFLIYSSFFSDTRSKTNVEADRVMIGKVVSGPFQEYITTSGSIVPSHSIFMDAVEGGIVKEIYKESGAIVEKGDLVMEITNSNLELEVMNREAQLYEQINLMRNTRLLVDQNSLNQQGQLAEIDYQLQILKPQYQRYKQLLEKKLVSEREFELLKEQYDYNLKRRKLTYASFIRDSMSRSHQLKQLNASEDRMIKSLEAVGKILDNLKIKSPLSGQLSLEELRIGQSIKIGDRLGQVDLLGKYKIKVPVDELYLSRISLGQKGSLEFSNKRFSLSIKKIYPLISNGQFEIDMEFDEEIPDGIKRGQTFNVRLELSQPSVAKLLPTGGFYKVSGGNWVYVIDPSGDYASKRTIKLGRKNPSYFEVLEGLEPGEKVITSSYEAFGDNEIIVLNKK